MKTRALISTFALTGLFFGCGKKTSEAVDALNGFLADPTGDITNNVAALAENQSDTMDELASSLNESGSAGASALTLGLAAPTKTKTVGKTTRTCTENSPSAGKVTVEITYQTGTDSSTKKGKGVAANAVSAGITGSGSLKRVWTPASPSDAVCANSGHFKFKNSAKTGADMNSLSLVETEDRTRTMNVTKGGKTLTGRVMKTKGDRTVTFSTTTDTDFTYEKTVTITDLTRTMTLTKPNGGTVERIKKITTGPDLKVKIKRDSSGELVKKVITAGTLKATTEASAVTDSTEVTTTFTNLTYSFDASTNDNPCTPIDGKISGKTFKSGAEVKAYEINYGADPTSFPSGISMTLGTDAAIDCPTCVVAKCDFE